MLVYAAFLMASFMIAGCGSTISMSVERPADFNMVAFNAIAVEGLSGEDSNEIAKWLEDVIQKRTRFELVSMNDVIRSPDSTAVISGFVTENNYSEDVTTKTITKKDKESGEKRSVKVFTRKGEMSVTVNLQIVNAKTSEVIHKKILSSTQSDSKKAEDQYPSEIRESTLFRWCLSSISKQFFRAIEPYTEKISVSFETDDKIPELKKGFETAKAGNWEGAIELFARATESTNNVVHKAHYNLGVALMFSDRFDESRSALGEALSLKPGEKKYQKALDALDEREYEQHRLSEQKATE